MLHFLLPRSWSNNVLSLKKSSAHSPFLSYVIYQDPSCRVRPPNLVVLSWNFPFHKKRVTPHNPITFMLSLSPLSFQKPSIRFCMAKQLEHYNILGNNIVDPSLQKGFLSGINGTVEHVFAITSTLDNATQHGLPLALTSRMPSVQLSTP